VQGAPAATQPEGIPAGRLVASAYGFIWLVVLLYIVFLFRREARLARELEALAGKIGKGAAG
jgi:CcmD family protein